MTRSVYFTSFAVQKFTCFTRIQKHKSADRGFFFFIDGRIVDLGAAWIHGIIGNPIAELARSVSADLYHIPSGLPYVCVYVYIHIYTLNARMCVYEQAAQDSMP